MVQLDDMVLVDGGPLRKVEWRWRIEHEELAEYCGNVRISRA